MILFLWRLIIGRRCHCPPVIIYEAVHSWELPIIVLNA